MSNAEKARLNTQIDAQLLSDLRKLSKIDCRTLRGQLEWVLKDYVNKNKFRLNAEKPQPKAWNDVDDTPLPE
jgi:hypothetical protein